MNCGKRFCGQRVDGEETACWSAGKNWVSVIQCPGERNTSRVQHTPCTILYMLECSLLGSREEMVLPWKRVLLGQGPKDEHGRLNYNVQVVRIKHGSFGSGTIMWTTCLPLQVYDIDIDIIYLVLYKQFEPNGASDVSG